MYESPIPARILAVDPGARSGWASFAPVAKESGGGFYVEAGSLNVWTPLVAHVVVLYQDADAIVIERFPTGSATKFLSQAFGLAEAVGAWRWNWRSLGRASEVTTTAVSWRAGILGAGPGRTTAQWKQASIEHVQELVNWPGSPIRMSIEGPLDHEIADAVSMGWWALHSPALADVLGPRRLKQLGWDDKAACLAAKKIRTNDRSAR